MKPAFDVFIHVSSPPLEVYQAVADPAQLSRYFTTGGSEGPMEAGKTVTWDFADFPGRFPVDVTEAEPSRRIAFDWGADRPGNFRTHVVFVFEPVDSGARTKVTISERGWPDSDEARTDAFGKCMGWSQMLGCLKAWVEHGINLREGAYK